MKNIHVLRTNKPSRLVLDVKNNNLFLTTTENFGTSIMKFRNIYITSDEEIKRDDWFYDENEIFKAGEHVELHLVNILKLNTKKIILTTDRKLIKDGVQAIEDEFLEWYIKNPSCEYVEVQNEDMFDETHGEMKGIFYKIIIPKETAEEAAKGLYPITNSSIFTKQDINHLHAQGGFINGAKWQANRMYTKEDMVSFATWLSELNLGLQHFNEKGLKPFNELFPIWVKQVKNK